ncbi:hypothetical protein GCM10023085_06900 [Actinomadura viridis]|uniref:Uncharacterized protein n=1 Tax=Actinomadura viridis TaxID=58110 RepID=A0A931GM52_9ACTN|nr:hypothetical protein [Actinomadura viridis]MBG6091700.1 hypothetical protein [Actinomadura viridis]
MAKLTKLINESTPLAPTTKKEVSERLEVLHREQARGKPPLPSEPQPETDSSGRDTTPEDRSEYKVYVPVLEKPHRNDGPVVVEYEVRELEKGRGAVPIYTTPEGLFDELGPYQPMVKVNIFDLLRYIQGRVPVVVDPILKAGIQKRDTKGADE